MAESKPWRVEILGVRGGTPKIGPEFSRYGGNTSCVALRRGGDTVFLDAGTGLSGAEPEGEVHILLSHVHIDHVLGLTDFSPLGEPGRRVVLWGAPGLRDALGRVIGPPGWPVRAENCPARVEFRELRPMEPARVLPWLTVTAMEGRHPGGSLIFRMEGDGKRVVYTPDCEPDGALMERLSEFAQNAQLLIWDANFTNANYRPGWGHSTWERGIEAGERSRARRVLMTHYASRSSDGFLESQERLSQEKCIFAREGMVIDLD